MNKTLKTRKSQTEINHKTTTFLRGDPKKKTATQILKTEKFNRESLFIGELTEIEDTMLEKYYKRWHL